MSLPGYDAWKTREPDEGPTCEHCGGYLHYGPGTDGCGWGCEPCEDEKHETEAREECARLGIDPDEICADGGVMAWMVVGKEMRTRRVSRPAPVASAIDDDLPF